MITVAIPTIKDNKAQLAELRPTLVSRHGPVQLLVVNKRQSAAKNRNECLDRAEHDIVVMMDDDIYHFYPGWLDDLVAPLVDHPDRYSIVSARFRRESGELQATLGDSSLRRAVGDLQTVCHSPATGLQLVCSACIAFRKSAGVRFDENYDGAVYEDTDFCMEMRRRYPDRDIVFNNRCLLFHDNEMKRVWKPGKSVATNKVYFSKKWGTNKV